MDADVILVNATSFTQQAWSSSPATHSSASRGTGKPVPVQPAESGLWADAGELEPYSVTCVEIDHRRHRYSQTMVCIRSKVVHGPLENDFPPVEFNPAGDITRIFDKRPDREVLAPNSIANQFQAFEDRPKDWDAWDVDIFYDDKMWLAEPAFHPSL
jgi:alpha-mannosidase